MEVIIDILSDIISVPLKKWDKLKSGYQIITASLLVTIIIGAYIYF
ncbi:hypothetical protein [Vallitalea maricola]|uniref:Uncharacterized protein n=1 Tax=Vallitalea maricola TaxID=3074433 RepID=A0ACB5UF06_9FIRM|nr:hypothetical protein AN2V17_07480 [Vallitalea sp. AN17-2]